MEEGVWWQGITNSTDVRWEHEPSGSCPCKAERPQGRAVPLGLVACWGEWGWERGPVWAREQPGLCTMVARAGRNTAHLQQEGFRSEFWKWALRQEQ